MVRYVSPHSMTTDGWLIEHLVVKNPPPLSDTTAYVNKDLWQRP